MIDFLQWIGAIGGVGAVFAVLMFFVYRQTIAQMREDRKYMEDSDCWVDADNCSDSRSEDVGGLKCNT